MSRFDGRTALVTGGSSGIGFATAQALTAEGATVVLVARDQDRLDAAAGRIAEATGRSPHTVAADLTTISGVEGAVASSIDAVGRIDLLVNVAGSAPGGSITALSDTAWATAIDLKLLGFIRTIRLLLPGMMERGSGRIVNIAGNAGRQPEGWLVTGSVINAAVIALTKAVSSEAARHGVTVNCICPGPTDTGRWPGLQKAYAGLRGVDIVQAETELLALIPDGRVTRPEEVAALVTYLMAPEAAHIVGQSIVIDGGQVLGP
jgi:NAD(P)-dependent dehydrogenase (short-subunit alcohol dehydrogenase family)